MGRAVANPAETVSVIGGSAVLRVDHELGHHGGLVAGVTGNRGVGAFGCLSEGGGVRYRSR